MANDIEINVRVADQTAGGLAGVNESMARLRTRAREASTAVAALRASLAGVASLDVDLNDNTASGVAAIESVIASLRAESPVRIEAEFTGDAAQIAETALAVRNLRTNAGSANTALATLSSRALAAAAALVVLTGAAQDASNALRTLRGRAAATANAMQDLRTHSSAAGNSLRTVSTRANSADGRLETLSNRTHALSTNMDSLDGSLRNVGGSLAGLRGSFGSLGSSAGGAANGSQKLLMAAIGLAPALIPITAAVAPLVPALGAAGAAMGAFGAALLPQILNIGKLGEAQRAYKKAVEDSGSSSKAAAEAEKDWLKEIAKASPEVRKAAAALGIMKDQYKDWTNGLAGDTLPVATKSFAVLGAIFPKLTPLVKAASVELDRLMNLLAVGVQSKGFDELIAKTADFSRRSLRAAVDGMIAFGQAVSRGIQSDGFREFLAYVRDSGPMVGETLANLGRALMKIVAAASDTGIGVLTLVNAFARLIDAMPTELLSVLLQAAFAIKAVQLAAVGFAVVAPIMTAAAAAVRTFIASAHFAGVSMAISGVAASMTALQKASVVLAVIAAVAVGINTLAEKARGAPPDVDRLTTSLKNFASTGKFTGELKKSFGDMDGLVKKLGDLNEATKKAGEAGKGAFGFKIPVLDDIGNWLGTKFTEMTKGEKSFRSLADTFKALDTAMANAVNGGNADAAAKMFTEAAKAAAANGYSLQQVKDAVPKYGEALQSLQTDQDYAAKSMGLFGDQAGAVQAKLDMQKQSADGLRQSIQALNDVNRTALDGMIGFEAAIDAAAKAAADNAGQLHMVDGALDLNEEKARDAASALTALAGKTAEAALAARDSGGSWDTISGIYERGREAMIANARQMGLTKDEAKALADQILKSPDKTVYMNGDITDLQRKLDDARARLAAAPAEKRVAIEAEISDLLKKMGQAVSAIDQVTGKTVYIRTIYQSFSEKHPGGQANAHGGIIGAAGGGPRSRMTLVGEQGPELVDLAPGSRVRSNPDSKRIAAGMAGGGGGGPVVIQLMLEGRQIAEAVFDPLRHEIRTRGGNVQAVLGQRGR